MAEVGLAEGTASCCCCRWEGMLWVLEFLEGGWAFEVGGVVVTGDMSLIRDLCGLTEILLCVRSKIYLSALTLINVWRWENKRERAMSAGY